MRSSHKECSETGNWRAKGRTHRARAASRTHIGRTHQQSIRQGPQSNIKTDRAHINRSTMVGSEAYSLGQMPYREPVASVVM